MSVFERIAIFLNRFTGAKGLEEALKQLVSPELVKFASGECPKNDLVEYIAEELFVPEKKLLTAVAERLDMQAVWDLVPPPKGVLGAAGHSVENLRSLGVIPQPSPASFGGYSLVVSDPESVDVGEYERSGIPVLLSFGREIELAWRRYDLEKKREVEISDERLWAIARNIARDANTVGASVVHLGENDATIYEFEADGRVYRGRLDERVYGGFLKRLETAGEMSLIVEQDGIRVVTVSLERESGRRIVVFSWNAGVQDESSVGEIENVDAATDVRDPMPVVSDRVISEEQGMPASTVNSSGGGSRFGRIMLIDDDECFTFVVEKILASKGWTVLTKNSARSALSELESDPRACDLAICDVHMPDMDGVACVRELKKLVPDMPILMLTSDTDGMTEAELVLLGVDAFIRKQEDPRVLVAWIKNLLNKSGSLVARSAEVLSGREEQVAAKQSA